MLRHIPSIIYYELQEEVCRFNNKKAPGYDFISSPIVKALPTKGVLQLTLVYNSIQSLQYFPSQWNFAAVVMIVQPGKPFDDVKSYWPINLLTIFSKIFERFFLKRLVPIINIKGFIPDYQFGFRSQHGTLKHSHRNLSFIRDALEN